MKLTIIKDLSEVVSGDGWVDSPKFRCKGKLISGNNYRNFYMAVAKKERNLTPVERVIRLILLAIPSIFSKDARTDFRNAWNYKVVIRYGIDEFKKESSNTTKVGNATLVNDTKISTESKKEIVESHPMINQASVALKPVPKNVMGKFASVNSNQLVEIPKTIKFRQDFKDQASDAPVISHSDFVSPAMVEHLMRNKKHMALAVKYVPGDNITNMEGLLHTFITPVTQINMLGDYAYKGGHSLARCQSGFARNVVLSAAIQPDFEYSNVMMELAALKENEVIGKDWHDLAIPEKEVKSDKVKRAEYDQKLLEHMIFHLVADNKLPSKNQVAVMDLKSAKEFLESIIHGEREINSLQNNFVKMNENVISLEVLSRVYLHQIQNEFSVLEAACTNGYVYTIDPPSIFAAAIGGTSGVEILNRLQAIAFKAMVKEKAFNNLKAVAFNDFADKGMIALLQNVFGNDKVVSKSSLFPQPEGKYVGLGKDDKSALVVHNNSDAFGQNIETEGPTSMDGVIGFYSDAYLSLKRDRPDLLSTCF